MVSVKMNTKLAFAIAGLSAALLASVPSGDADCCGAWYSYGHEESRFASRFTRCADCTRPKVFFCAVGSGGCNVFGCNCEGGCRQPVEGRLCSQECCDERNDRKARDVGVFAPLPFPSNFTGNDVMNHIDTNEDGRLDTVELDIFVIRHALPADAWRALDADGDDHLTAHEIDRDLVPTATVVV